MSRPERLDHTENLFWDLITAPEGVGPGLEELVRRGRAASGDLEAMIAGDARLPAADRLDIYANMYFFRLLDCLKEDYPRLLEAIGPDRFHNLATDYLLACPSAHPSLRYLGARFPDFLRAHTLGLEAECLVDLARLEWARADLFDAADAPLLTRDALARLSEEQAAGLRLRLVPAFRLLRLDHDAPRLWRELRDRSTASAPIPGATRAASESASGADSAGEHWAAGQANNARLGDDGDTRAPHACQVHGGEERTAAPLPRQRRRPTSVRVWRRAFTVWHRAVGEEEAAALDLAGAGEALQRIAQRVAAGQSPSRATESFGRLFQSWLDDGLLASPPETA
jgi:hypothetical protein